MQQWMRKRQCGVLLPIFSLPSDYGIGSFGEAAYRFVDWVASCGMTLLLLLPMGHTDKNNCPYQAYDNVAGNPLLIDLEWLVKKGLITQQYLDQFKVTRKKRIDYKQVRKNHMRVIWTAYLNSDGIWDEVEAFVKDNKEWLEEYALFMVCRDLIAKRNEGRELPVSMWPEKLRKRNPETIRLHKEILAEDMRFYYFVQYLFYTQFDSLREYAHSKGIMIGGDIPIYPNPNSTAVWKDRVFNLEDDLSLSVSAGVPGDQFTEDGQNWGNPTYDWPKIKEQGYEWWINRIRHTMMLYDVIRFDHFRGFEQYYAIPIGERDANKGRWYPGPGRELFDAIKESLGEVPSFAEDLGIVTKEVKELVEDVDFPSMGVEVFAFESGDPDNMYMPEKAVENEVYFLSTHDTSTVMETLKNLDDEKRSFALKLLGNPDMSIDYEKMIELINVGNQEAIKRCPSYAAIRAALESKANMVIIYAPELLGMAEEGRMNTPSTIREANWSLIIPEIIFSYTIIAVIRQMLAETDRLAV